MYDICIIGGGASGMAAAIGAVMEAPNLKVCILEKKDSLGKKLRATGNGKCNISNLRCEKSQETIDFFNTIGVSITEEEGWLYPMSRQAEDVVFALESAIERYNISIIVNFSVDTIVKEDDGFIINEEIRCKSILLATGGKAGPQFGTTGDGYRLAKSFGHQITPLAPVLTALESSDLSGLKGVRAKGRVSLFCRERIVAAEDGEVQFTEDGLSGICIFNLSRFVKLNDDTAFTDYEVHVDFLPDISQEELIKTIEERKNVGVNPIRSMVPIKLCKRFMRTGENTENLACQLKDFIVPVTGAKGWKWAQCTAGGIMSDELQNETLESKLVEGLYFAGEILDFDGPCGGYNLQNAWETGLKAGRSMAKRGRR